MNRYTSHPSVREMWAAMLTLLCVLAVTTSRGQTISPAGGYWSTPRQPRWTNWHAQWIWLPADSDADMMLARCTFALPEPLQQAVLSITATSAYQLWLNGRYVGRGPARCAPHHQSYDMWNAGGLLRQGQNVVAVRVHYQRDTVSYYAEARPGLLVQLDGQGPTGRFRLSTGPRWRVSPDPSWSNGAPRMARFHLQVCDRVDLRRKVNRWQQADYDDRRWQPARVLRRETGWPLPQPDDRPAHLTAPWTLLVPRDIPYLTESIVEAEQPVHVGTVAADRNVAEPTDDRWVDVPAIRRIAVPPHVDRQPAGRSDNRPKKNGPIVLQANPPGRCRVMIFDLGQVHNGRPFLEISGPAGAVVDVMAAPYLLSGEIRSPIVASTYVDRIVLSGQRDRWEALYWKPVRWLAVVLRRMPAEARLYRAGVVSIEYPFHVEGSFQSPDFPQLQKLWQAAAKTIRVCTTDAYTDNYRERRQYAQTAYYACLGNYAVFGDTALQRRYLVQIAQEQLADGLMPAYAPRHGDDFMVILDSNCFWIRGLRQYLLYSGDEQTARQLLPAARKLLELLHSYTGADGLIDRPPHPYWLDHAWLDRRGANFCLNAHYLAALDDFADVLDWLGQPDGERYRQRAAQLRRSLSEKFWDPQRRLVADALVDGKRSRRFSEQANAMALALRIVAPEQMHAVAAELSRNEPHDFVRRQSGLVMVTPAMSYLLHAGLCEARRGDESFSLLWARMSHMLGPQSNGTLWEEWWLDGTGRSGKFRPYPSGRSDAQTESAFVPGLFARYILGIEPTAPGVRQVVLRYWPSRRLLHRRGSIPTPRGKLEVAWDVRPGQINCSVQVPPETVVKLDLSSLGSPAAEQITVDGRPARAKQLQHGYLPLSAGAHTIGVRRD